MWTLQKNPEFFWSFAPVPINPSAHPLWSHCTYHIRSHRSFCSELLHNTTKEGYYGRQIPGIMTICHQIYDALQSEINTNSNLGKCLSPSYPAAHKSKDWGRGCS